MKRFLMGATLVFLAFMVISVGSWAVSDYSGNTRGNFASEIYIVGMLSAEVLQSYLIAIVASCWLAYSLTKRSLAAKDIYTILFVQASLWALVTFYCLTFIDHFEFYLIRNYANAYSSHERFSIPDRVVKTIYLAFFELKSIFLRVVQDRDRDTGLDRGQLRASVSFLALSIFLIIQLTLALKTRLQWRTKRRTA